MYHNRIIPCLLLSGRGLVKTINFKDGRYLGDPINAVHIYNDSEVDELIFLDINATKEKREPDYAYLSKITQQCFMPLCYGGGVKNISEIKRLFEIGFEKIAINSALYYNPRILSEASEIFGSQSILGAIDIKSDRNGHKSVYICNGKINTKTEPVEYAKRIEELGAGELLVNSIDQDGMMAGYDLDMIERISGAVNIPIIACGGAGNLRDCKKVVDAGASAAAAGSLFVYWGRNKAVLINYAGKEEIEEVFK